MSSENQSSPLPSPMDSSASSTTLTGPSPTFNRPRGLSTITIRPMPSRFGSGGLSPTTLSPTSHHSPLGFIHESDTSAHNPVSSFLSRTRSKSHSFVNPPKLFTPAPPQEQAMVPTSWWGRNVRDESDPRPWSDPPKCQGTVPAEQADSWAHTRKRVSAAAGRILGASLPVAHEALLLTSEFLEVVPVPIPGLQEAAKLLLTIWDSVQSVDLNRMACLRLTERCAEILLSVREEIKDAGEKVAGELQMPIDKLVESFTRVQNFMLKQAHRPFLKRYLKRTEIIRDIAGCDKGLTDALSMFGFSIQIRILKQVQANERQRQSDARTLLEAVVRSQQQIPSAPSATLQGLGIIVPKDTSGLPPSSSHKSLSDDSESESIHPDAVLPTLQSLHTMQNHIDLAQDTADLRALMRDAVSCSSDAEMLRVLQVGREEYPEALKTLQRALERVSVINASPSPLLPEPTNPIPSHPSTLAPQSIERSVSASSSGSSAIGSSCNVGRDVLDREFMESGIDALRRLSKGTDLGLPSWTITRYEVDRDAKIGVGFFSSVYRGRWRNRTVAIKVLAPCTPQELFVKEVAIWKEFKHPHVLELYGASGASGDGPYFFVCPYEQYGSLSEFLRRISKTHGEGGGGSNIRERHASFPGRTALGSGSGMCSSVARARHSASEDLSTLHCDTDLLRFMHEIAKGMDYLHGKGVLHGDLKAANILVDDHIHCLVSDFGQSELKSEVFRISGTTPPHGTLRWQAPELMLGHGQLTTAVDVYSYAICCVEILTMGKLPWPVSSDDDVRHFVLKEHTRPIVPPSRCYTPALQELLQACWSQDPFTRPPFSKVVREMKQLRKSFCGSTPSQDIPSPRIMQEANEDELYMSRPSPDMHPIPLPNDAPSYRSLAAFPFGPSLSAVPVCQPIREASEDSMSDLSHSFAHSSLSYQEDTVATPRTHMTQVVFTPSKRGSTLLSSAIPHLNPSEEDLTNLLLNRVGNASPPPVDERMRKLRNERRYRLLLCHEFHPSLTLPLWTPSPISLGAVGYLSKPNGQFITIFNCFAPEKTAIGDLKSLPSVHGYGNVSVGAQRQDKRNAALRGLDAIAGLLTFKTRSDGPISQSVSRRYSYPLRAGHKTAHLCTETTMYRYVENLDAPKKWFKANVDAIMETYGPMHGIQKEDLFLVIGTLSAPDYGLFVSHRHADGQAHFNVFSSYKAGQTWGTFTTDTGSELGGPTYHEPVVGNPQSASKVSMNAPGTSGSSHLWDTVLVARLRFKPDVLDPTSL